MGQKKSKYQKKEINEKKESSHEIMHKLRGYGQTRVDAIISLEDALIYELSMDLHDLFGDAEHPKESTIKLHFTEKNSGFMVFLDY